jgi:hypothetical protein
LADGRDLLLHVLPGGKTEWQPSITLFEIIQEFPNFIRSFIQQKDKAS